MSVEVKFGGAHMFLDASLHFMDLRGRNVLLNAARWLVALTAAKTWAVHVHVEADGVDWDVLRELAYLVYPARVEAGDVKVRELGCAEGGGVCTLCGRGGVVARREDWLSHVTRGEALDAPCLAARLFGRAANKPAFLFALFERDSLLRVLPGGPTLALPLGFSTLYFWRHGEGGGGECLDDSAALCYHNNCVAVLGVRRECVKERANVERYLEAVRRAERFEEAAAAREEFLRRVAEEAAREELKPVYQPRGGSIEEGFVPHLSGVNAGGEEVDTEILASLAGTNTVFLVRVDGDRFGERARQMSEEVLAQFKSAVAGVFEAGPQAARQARYHAAVIYAGGDENMFVASARSVNAVLETLLKAREFFVKAFGGTISAGVVALRYKLPMYHAVYHVNRAAEAAKEAGRDAIALIYLKSILAEEMGVVKFSALGEALRLARRYADERPPLEAECLQQALSHLLGPVPAAAGLDKTVAFILNAALLLRL